MTAPASAERPAEPRVATAPQDPAFGLSDAEAAARLRSDGPNRLPQAGERSLLRIVGSVLAQPMLLLLLATAGVYAAIGSAADATVLGVSIVVVVAIAVHQQQRSESALAALRSLASPRATVIRSGRTERIGSESLVRGDRLIVDEGDRMACDAVLLQANGLLVDESTLTGESAPVLKSAVGNGAPLDAASEAERLRAGSLVVQGDGIAEVVATGARTALGRIGGALAGAAPPKSRVERELAFAVRWVAVLALAVSVLAGSAYAWRQADPLQGLLVGLTLAMAVIPEEFAVVWTVLMALGALRIARIGVLTRQAQAIEALGTTTVLCVDKTGTLTHNRMTLVALHDGRCAADVRADEAVEGGYFALVEAAALASVPNGIEPMDRAVLALHAASGGELPPPERLVERLSVAAGRPYVSARWQVGSQTVVAAKGAPEAVLALSPAEDELREALATQAAAWAADGWRVLAVARGDAPGDGALVLRALGLLAFEDPLRPEVHAAVAECQAAGIRVVMITGDAPATGLAIARHAGLVPPGAGAGASVSGAQLDRIGDAELGDAVRRTAVYARVDPQQKLRIVHALQRNGEVVAMTGDGVNDAPALRAADIGVAMGERGTDVAREAASLVLLRDDFAALVAAVRAGRRIFVNLQKAVGYLFAVHVPIVGVALVPVLYGGPVLLLPVHVVLLELIIDPACSLVFEAEPEPADCMRMPPRSPQQRLFGWRDLGRAWGLGALALLAVLLVDAVCRQAAASGEATRLAVFATIVAGNLAMLWWSRRGRGAGHRREANPLFDALVLGVCVLFAAMLLIAPVARQLGFPAAIGWPWLAPLGAPAAWLAGRLWQRRKAGARGALA